VSKADSEWKSVNLAKQFEFSKFQFGEKFQFEMGQIRISKITFDFSQ